MKTGRHFEIEYGGRHGAFWYRTDPQKLFISYLAVYHNFMLLSQNARFFSHIRPTIRTNSKIDTAKIQSTHLPIMPLKASGIF